MSVFEYTAARTARRAVLYIAIDMVVVDDEIVAPEGWPGWVRERLPRRSGNGR
jgi:hypothetical protein